MANPIDCLAIFTSDEVDNQMPTYLYRCADCGNEFDRYQKFSEDPLTDCPSCAGKVRRVIQPVGVVFKGSGWYVNDSRPSSSNGTDKSDKTEKTDKSEAGQKAEASTPTGDGKDATTAKKSETSKPTEAPKAKGSKVAAGT
jgi:putative FmdB family regulatory protein